MENLENGACRLCGAATKKEFSATILKKHEVAYHLCGTCGYLQTDKPFWLDEAYANPINLADTGLLQRNLILSRLTKILIRKMGAQNGKFLDFAGGYGVFTRLMRDAGLDFYWDDEHTQNLVARGFEGKESRYTAITAFEVLEHLVDPVGTLREMFNRTDTIIFSTTLRPATVPDQSWDYYGFTHGQHIGFFNLPSLQRLAEILGVRLVTEGTFYHVLTTARSVPAAMPFSKSFFGKVRYLIGLLTASRGLESKTVSDSKLYL